MSFLVHDLNSEKSVSCLSVVLLAWKKSVLFCSNYVKVSVLLDMNSEKVSVLFGSISMKVLVLLDMNTEKSVLFDSKSVKVPVLFDMNT